MDFHEAVQQASPQVQAFLLFFAFFLRFYYTTFACFVYELVNIEKIWNNKSYEIHK